MNTQPGTIPGTIYKRAILVDTGPLYALADRTDARHNEAEACLHEITRQRFPLFANNLTIAECHRRILQNRGIERGLEFLASIHDGSVNIVWVGPEDAQKARQILERYRDQDISFTDAASLAVMARLGIIKALSFDWHFDLLGFRRIPPLENLLT